MSTPCIGETYVQSIDRTECIGNSLLKINSNFKNLDLAACEFEQRLADLGEITNLSVKDSSTINLTYNTTLRILSAEVVGKISNENGGAGVTTGILKSLEGVVSSAVPDVDYVTLDTTNGIQANISFLSGQVVSLSSNAFASLSTEILARLGQDFAFGTDLRSLSSQVYSLAAAEIHNRTYADEVLTNEFRSSLESEIEERKDALYNETFERIKEDSTERSERIEAINQTNLDVLNLKNFVNAADLRLSTKIDGVSSSATYQFTNLTSRVASLSTTASRELTNQTNSLSSTTSRLVNTLNNTILSLSSTANREISSVDTSVNTRISNLSAQDVRALSIIGGTVRGTTAFSVSSETPALLVTQTGTGNAIVVEDNTNPDLTPFVVNQYGQTIIGKSSTRMLFDTLTGVVPSLQVEGDDLGKSSMLLCGDTTNAFGGGTVYLGRTRSSNLNGSEVVKDNDLLGLVSFNGADGNKLVQGAHIAAYVRGTPSNNSMPTELVFSTSPAGSSAPIERVSISPQGITSFTGSVEIKSTDRYIPALTIFNEGSGNCLEIRDELNDTTPLVVDKNGNVGIGQTNPTAKLHVKGDVSAELLGSNVTFTEQLFVTRHGITTICDEPQSSSLIVRSTENAENPCMVVVNEGNGNTVETRGFVIDKNGSVEIGGLADPSLTSLYVEGEVVIDGELKPNFIKLQSFPNSQRVLLEVPGRLSASSILSKEYQVDSKEDNSVVPPVIGSGTYSPNEYYADATVGSLYLKTNGAVGNNLYIKETTGWNAVNNTTKIDKPSNPAAYSTLIYNPVTTTWVASSEPRKIIQPSTVSPYQVLAYSPSTSTWIASSVPVVNIDGLTNQVNDLTSQVNSLLSQLSIESGKRPVIFNTTAFNGSPTTPKTITKSITLEVGTYDATLKYYVDVPDGSTNTNYFTSIEFKIIAPGGNVLAADTGSFEWYKNGGAGYGRVYDNAAIAYQQFGLMSRTTVTVEIKLIELYGEGKHTEFVINPVVFS